MIEFVLFVCIPPAAFLAGFVAGANSTARKACRFKHDWRKLSTEVHGTTAVSKERCVHCDKRRKHKHYLPG
jgi:hypothetical protein